MQRLDIGSVRNWSTITPPAVVTPTAIALPCSYCFSYVVITVSHLKYDHPRKTVSCSGACPACGETAHFWLTGVIPKNESTNDLELYTKPVNRRFHQVTDYSENVPEAIRRNHAAAIDSFNSRNPLATVVLCRATVEAILKHLVPGGKRRRALAKIIEEAGEGGATDLARPLTSLLKTLQKSDSVGTHFNPANQPDDPAAHAMLELTGLLITYLFAVPGQIDKLEKFLVDSAHNGAEAKKLPAKPGSDRCLP